MLCGMLAPIFAEHTFLYPLQSICLSKWGVKKLRGKHFEFMHRGDLPMWRAGFFKAAQEAAFGPPPGPPSRGGGRVFFEAPRER